MIAIELSFILPIVAYLFSKFYREIPVKKSLQVAIIINALLYIYFLTRMLLSSDSNTSVLKFSGLFLNNIDISSVYFLIVVSFLYIFTLSYRNVKESDYGIVPLLYILVSVQNVGVGFVALFGMCLIQDPGLENRKSKLVLLLDFLILTSISLIVNSFNISVLSFFVFTLIVLRFLVAQTKEEALSIDPSSLILFYYYLNWASGLMDEKKVENTSLFYIFLLLSIIITLKNILSQNETKLIYYLQNSMAIFSASLIVMGKSVPTLFHTIWVTIILSYIVIGVLKHEERFLEKNNDFKFTKENFFVSFGVLVMIALPGSPMFFLYADILRFLRSDYAVAGSLLLFFMNTILFSKILYRLFIYKKTIFVNKIYMYITSTFLIVVYSLCMLNRNLLYEFIFSIFNSSKSYVGTNEAISYYALLSAVLMTFSIFLYFTTISNKKTEYFLIALYNRFFFIFEKLDTAYLFNNLIFITMKKINELVKSVTKICFLTFAFINFSSSNILSFLVILFKRIELVDTRLEFVLLLVILIVGYLKIGILG